MVIGAVLKNLLFVTARSKCDKDREAAAGKNYRAIKEGTEQAPEYVPQCNTDGSYKRIQLNGPKGYAFCVDEQTGKEIDGTRKGFLEGRVVCPGKNEMTHE